MPEISARSPTPLGGWYKPSHGPRVVSEKVLPGRTCLHFAPVKAQQHRLGAALKLQAVHQAAGQACRGASCSNAKAVLEQAFKHADPLKCLKGAWYRQLWMHELDIFCDSN